MEIQNAIFYVIEKIVCWSDKDSKDRHDLINLLKRCGEYKKRWEYFKRKYGSYNIYCFDNPDHKQNISDVMNEIEQMSDCKEDE